MRGNRGRTWAVFIIACAGFLLSMFYRVSATVVSDDLARDLHLSPAELGNVSAAFFYVFATVQLIIGPALDRFGPRRVMTSLGLVAVAGAVLFARAESLTTALVARGLLGLGMSGNFMGALMLVARWFAPSRFATVSGLLAAVGSCGMALAATPLAWLSETLGWRGAFLAIAGLNAVELLALIVLVRDAPAGQPARRASGPSPLENLGRLTRSWAYWGISLGTFFRYGCMMALFGLWAGPYLTQGLGLDAIAAGNVMAAGSVGYVLGLPLSGRLSDSVLNSRRLVIMPSLWIMAGMSLALTVLPPQASGGGFWLVGGFFFLFGLACAPGQIMYPHVKELMPPAMTATAMTGINIFTMLGPALVMNLTGLMVGAEAGSLSGPAPYRPVFWLFALGLGAAATAYMFIPDAPAGGRPADDQGDQVGSDA